jgi:hypothetical protein
MLYDSTPHVEPHEPGNARHRLDRSTIGDQSLTSSMETGSLFELSICMKFVQGVETLPFTGDSSSGQRTTC